MNKKGPERGLESSAPNPQTGKLYFQVFSQYRGYLFSSGLPRFYLRPCFGSTLSVALG